MREIRPLLLFATLLLAGIAIPAVIVVGFVTDLHVQLGLDQLDTLLLVLTLLVSTITFAGERTNSLQGAVHIMLFIAWIVLIFD